MGSNGARHWRKSGAARDSSNREGTAAFRVYAQSAEGKSEDSSETSLLSGYMEEKGPLTYAFEAEDQNKKSNAGLASGEDSSEGEDEAEEQVDGEDATGFKWTQRHEITGDKTHEGIESLTHRKEICY
ncbi:MAG: hypothetical protein Q9157_005627 [Trypethelium eluteriae]